MGEQILSLHSSLPLSTSKPPSSPGSSSSQAPTFVVPAQFAGDSGDCKTFITQCSIHFELSLECYTTDRAPVVFAISHLSGRAEAWAAAECDHQSSLCDSFQEFAKALRLTFQTVPLERHAAQKLACLRQGNRSIRDYAVEFRTLAVQSHWN